MVGEEENGELKKVIARTTVLMVYNERLTKSAYLLLLMRASASSFGDLCELPGGKQEDGDSLPDTVIKEVGEETGIELSLGKLQVLSPRQRTGRSIEREDPANKRTLVFLPYLYELTVPSLPEVHLSQEHTDSMWLELPGVMYRHEFDGTSLPVTIRRRQSGIAVASFSDRSYQGHVDLRFTETSGAFVQRYLSLDADTDYMPSLNPVRPDLYKRDILEEKFH